MRVFLEVSYIEKNGVSFEGYVPGIMLKISVDRTVYAVLLSVVHVVVIINN